MNTAVYSTKQFDRAFLTPLAAQAGHRLRFLEARLTEETASLPENNPVACIFVNDQGHAAVLERLAERGVKMLALRSAGFNHVDLEAADRLGMTVARVPAYSPDAVAEHAMGLILALNRKFHKAYQRGREGNFSIDGLMGFDVAGKTVGVVGTGKIGLAFARIAKGFNARILASDPYPTDEAVELGVTYVDHQQLIAESDIISLHCPLTPKTYHIIDDRAMANIKPGAMLINTSRGALVDTRAVVDALKDGRLGYLGLDVYEEESDFFFRDLSDRVLRDDLLARLLTFPNVLVTSHQAFFTREAVEAIAQTTINNITAFTEGGAEAIPKGNLVSVHTHAAS
jgi:D-lactate dehydrogenase